VEAILHHTVRCRLLGRECWFGETLLMHRAEAMIVEIAMAVPPGSSLP